jgi:hypothetical protein
MPLKIIKAKTVDQVISEFNEWEARALKEHNQSIEARASIMIAQQNKTQFMPAQLYVMNLQLHPATWEEKRRIPVFDRDSNPHNVTDSVTESLLQSGWVLSFLHNSGVQ